MQLNKNTVNLPVGLWAKDYGENLTFEILRERYFPEFPKSIFYTRKSMPKPASDWITTFGSFGLREKIFCMDGEVHFRESDSDPKWQLCLRAGEYAEITGSNYQVKFVAPNNLYYRVIERPPSNSQLWNDALHVGQAKPIGE